MIVGMKSVVLIILSVLFFKYAKLLKKEDCTDGIQYFIKKGITGDGDCPNCPPDWTTCSEESIDNRKSCEDSCRPKPKPSPLLPPPAKLVNVSSATPKSDENIESSTASTSTYKSTSSMSTLSIKTPGFPSSLPVLNSSTKANVDKSRHDENEIHETTLIISLCVVFCVVALVVAVVQWLRCRQRKKSVEVEAGGRPFQGTETVARIQNTEERRNSSLGLPEDCW